MNIHRFSEPEKLEEAGSDSGLLNSMIEQGIAELDNGDYVDGESFMQKLLDDLDERIAADTNQ